MPEMSGTSAAGHAPDTIDASTRVPSAATGRLTTSFIELPPDVLFSTSSFAPHRGGL
jgi:hypothetical protein